MIGLILLKIDADMLIPTFKTEKFTVWSFVYCLVIGILNASL